MADGEDLDIYPVKGKRRRRNIEKNSSSSVITAGETIDRKDKDEKTMKKRRKPVEKVAKCKDESKIEIKKKKRKRKMAESESRLQLNGEFQIDSDVANHIDYLKDDIVTVSEVVDVACQSTEGGKKLSEPSSKVFIELPRGFKEVNRASLKEGDILDVCHEPYGRSTIGKIDMAIWFQRSFHRLSILCHGLTAGAAFMECLIIYFLREPHFPHDDFAQHYSPMAGVIRGITYILLVTCLLDTLDKCDLGRGSVDWADSNTLTRILALGSSGTVVLLYAIALVLSLSTVDVDFRYRELNNMNDTREINNLQDLSFEHSNWWALTISRCVAVCACWILMTFRRPDDVGQLERRLIRIRDREKESSCLKPVTMAA